MKKYILLVHYICIFKTKWNDQTLQSGQMLTFQLKFHLPNFPQNNMKTVDK